MKLNDPVTYTIFTDAKAGWVSKVSPNGKTIEVEFAEQTLLNHAGSGIPDALVFTPGGFVGHTYGNQRWLVERAEKPARAKFTLRKNGQWKYAGHPTNSPGCVLRPGHNPYYDFNF
jgi:hypothetical protein